MKDYDVVLLDTVGQCYDGNTVSGVGGCEFAAIRLSTALAATGKSVLVLNNSPAQNVTSPVSVARVDYLDANHGKPIRARTLLYWRNSRVAHRNLDITADKRIRMVHDLGIAPNDTSLNVYNSAWHHSVSRPAGEHPFRIVPPLLPEEAYVLAEPEVEYNTYLYASAACKGWTETLALWRMLKTTHDFQHMRLRVLDSGYDTCAMPQDAENLGISQLQSLTTAETIRALDRAEKGIFAVNIWPETYGMMAALAEYRQRIPHILCLSDPGSLPSTIPFSWASGGTTKRLDWFLETVYFSVSLHPRLSTQINQGRLAAWLEIL